MSEVPLKHSRGQRAPVGLFVGAINDWISDGRPTIQDLTIYGRIETAGIRRDTFITTHKPCCKFQQEHTLPTVTHWQVGSPDSPLKVVSATVRPGTLHRESSLLTT